MQAVLNSAESATELVGVPAAVIFTDWQAVRVDSPCTSDEDSERWDGLS